MGCTQRRDQLVRKALRVVIWILSRERAFRTQHLSEALGIPDRTSRRWVKAAVDIGLVVRVRPEQLQLALYRRIGGVKITQE